MPNHVDSTVYDHTSVLRFLEWRFLGAPAHGPGHDAARWSLTRRDRHANNYGRTLSAGDPNPEVDLKLQVKRPTPPCGNELDLERRDPQADPFRLSQEMQDLTGRLYPEPTLTPWLDHS